MEQQTRTRPAPIRVPAMFVRVAAVAPAMESEPYRGTPMEALLGWLGAVVVGVACWAGALSVLARLV